MTWTNEALAPYAAAHDARAAGVDYRIGSAPIVGWQAGFLELAAELLALRSRLAPKPEDLRSLETIWQPKLNCPSCARRLEPMEGAPPGTTGVCPSCGDLVRSFAIAVEAPEHGAACPACALPVRTYLATRIYTDAEADENAHPEVLAKLRAIQAKIRAAAICGCDNKGATTGPCVCCGGCECHGPDNDIDLPDSQVTRSDAAITCVCEFEDALACSVNRNMTTPDTEDPCGCPCHVTRGTTLIDTPALARKEGRDRTCIYSDEQLRADVGAGPCSGPVAIRDSWPDGYSGTLPVYGCEGHGEFMRELMG